jgi:hypothetical protein
LPPRESQRQSADNREAAALRSAAGADFIGAALAHLRAGVSPDDGSPATATLAGQKKNLCEWARSAGLLLTPAQLPALIVRGGQEHDLFHDEVSDRYFKVTRGGVFGLSPGIELALVSSSADARRFHLWEATPLEYLERLRLHNLLVPGLNRLEGILSQPDGDLAIVTSQPRFEIIPVTEIEIDRWFAAQGFQKITAAGFYREADNLGVFDAHDKNVVRFEQDLIPFDVIPCQPAGGFKQFIADTLSAGHVLRAVRTVSTTSKTTEANQ